MEKYKWLVICEGYLSIVPVKVLGLFLLYVYKSMCEYQTVPMYDWVMFELLGLLSWLKYNSSVCLVDLYTTFKVFLGYRAKTLKVCKLKLSETGNISCPHSDR